MRSYRVLLDRFGENWEEGRYKSLFSSMDLTRDFYFSYSYDLTSTLQDNFRAGTPPISPLFPRVGTDVMSPGWDFTVESHQLLPSRLRARVERPRPAADGHHLRGE